MTVKILQYDNIIDLYSKDTKTNECILQRIYFLRDFCNPEFVCRETSNKYDKVFLLTYGTVNVQNIRSTYYVVSESLKNFPFY